MVDYIHELINYLRDCFDTRQAIRFNLQIEPVELDLTHCIPIGLILNEAITNSIKYAFAKNDEGVIDIIFKRKSQNSLAALALACKEPQSLSINCPFSAIQTPDSSFFNSYSRPVGLFCCIGARVFPTK